MPAQHFDHPPRHLVVRRAFRLDPGAAEMVDRFGARIPIVPARRGPDQMRLGAAVLEHPRNFDRIAVLGQRRGFEIEKDEHGAPTPKSRQSAIRRS
jgi:hypothetical protein